MWDDPIVAETRQARDQIALRFGYEIQGIGEYFNAKRASEARALIEKVVAQTKKSSTRLPVMKPNKKKRAAIEKVEAVPV